MIDGKTIRSKRVTAGLAGHILCKRLGIARSRLSDIERGYSTPKAEEAERINAALDELIQTKRNVQQLAASLGWPGLNLGE